MCAIPKFQRFQGITGWRGVGDVKKSDAKKRNCRTTSPNTDMRIGVYPLKILEFWNIHRLSTIFVS